MFFTKNEFRSGGGLLSEKVRKYREIERIKRDWRKIHSQEVRGEERDVRKPSILTPNTLAICSAISTPFR